MFKNRNFDDLSRAARFVEGESCRIGVFCRAVVAHREETLPNSLRSRCVDLAVPTKIQVRPQRKFTSLDEGGDALAATPFPASFASSLVFQADDLLAADLARRMWLRNQFSRALFIAARWFLRNGKSFDYDRLLPRLRHLLTRLIRVSYDRKNSYQRTTVSDFR